MGCGPLSLICELSVDKRKAFHQARGPGRRVNAVVLTEAGLPCRYGSGRASLAQQFGHGPSVRKKQQLPGCRARLVEGHSKRRLPLAPSEAALWSGGCAAS
jgi:hypothetical protein